MSTTRIRKRRQDITSIQVQKSTRAKLDQLGDIHSETYDDIIQRLIQFYNKERVTISLPNQLLERIRKFQRDPATLKLLKTLENEDNPMLVLTR